MGTLIIIFIILAILLFLADVILLDDDSDITIGIEIGIIIASVITVFVSCLKNEIPAIEVYRGNTELQITYRDSTPIDSVVVYKNKNKNK